MPLRLLLLFVAGLASLTPIGPSPACCSIPIPSSESVQEPTAETLLLEFKSLYKAARYHEAEEMALKARRLDPQYAMANGALFLARRQLTTVRGKLRAMEDGKAVVRRLKATASVKYEDAPLKRVLEELAEAYGIVITPDLPALAEAGISLDSPITMNVERVPLESVLNLVLDQVKLGCAVKDSLVVVTTPEVARGKVVAISYPVADLILPIPKVVGQKPETKTTEAKLIEDIVSTIAPKSWAANGGEGQIDYHPLTMSLVVAQNPGIQEQIADYLASVRRIRDRQIVLEMKFIRVPADAAERLGVSASQNDSGLSTTMLGAADVAELLEAIESECRAVITSAPRLTIFDGQTATVEIDRNAARLVAAERCRSCPTWEGIRTTIQARYVVEQRGHMVFGYNPVKRFEVKLDVDMASASANDQRPVTFRLDTTLKIPEGKSALLTDWSPVREQRRNPCCSVRATRKELYLVLITPRLVEQKEPPAPPIRAESQEAKPVPAAEPVVQQEGTPVSSPVRARSSRILSTNSREFALSYCVANVGPSKLSGVDVYYQRNGMAWERYPESVKPTGNVPVTVKHDGLYGFHLIAKNGALRSKPAPRGSDEAHIWIEVDTTPPQVTLHTPTFGDKVGQVILTWEAIDKNLANEPILLEYSSDDLVWNRIGSGANTGRYVWTVPADLPAKVYLRLTARDRAGNVATAQTPSSILIDTHIPEVCDVELKATPTSPR